MNKSNSLLTVGIATCYGGQNLLNAAKSIMASKNIEKFRFIIVADTIPIKGKILNELQNMGVEVYQNQKRASQASKFRQIIAKTRSKYLVFTQDDLSFTANTLKEILNEFEKDEKLTLITTKVSAEKSTSLMESILEVGVRGYVAVGKYFKRGDNYLLVNGRCMAFRTDHLKKMDIRTNIANFDAYLYFENKANGGKFKFLESACVFIKSPIKLKEHMHQSSRFQYSKTELNKYFDITNEYEIPFTIYLMVGIAEFFHDPFYSVLYLILFIYSRLRIQNIKGAVNAKWRADVSTKRLS